MRLLLRFVSAALLLQAVYASRAWKSKHLASISSASVASVASLASAASAASASVTPAYINDFDVELQAIVDGMEEVGLIDYIKEAKFEESPEAILLEENSEVDVEDDIFGPDVDYVASSSSVDIDVSVSEVIDDLAFPKF